MLFRLGIGVRPIKKEGCNFFKGLFADVHGTMDAVARLRPVYLAGGQRFTMGFAAVLEFDIEKISAKNDGDAMERIAVPGSGLTRGQPQSSD